MLFAIATRKNVKDRFGEDAEMASGLRQAECALCHCVWPRSSAKSQWFALGHGRRLILSEPVSSCVKRKN